MSPTTYSGARLCQVCVAAVCSTSLNSHLSFHHSPGPGCTIASGVVGSLGGSEVKSFSSAAEAVAAVEKLAEAKLKAGYRNVLPEASNDGVLSCFHKRGVCRAPDLRLLTMHGGLHCAGSVAEAAVAVATGEAAGDSTVKPDDADCWDGIHPELVEQFKRIGCTCKAPPAEPRSARVNFTPPGGEMREVSIEEDLLRVLYDVHFPNKHFWRQSDVDDGEPQGDRHYWETGPGPLCTPGQIYLCGKLQTRCVCAAAQDLTILTNQMRLYTQ